MLRGSRTAAGLKYTRGLRGETLVVYALGGRADLSCTSPYVRIDLVALLKEQVASPSNSNTRSGVPTSEL